MLYYKIPPRFVEMLGLASTLVQFPDGNYFVPRAVMAQIDPDIDNALELTGGITLTLDEARDEQLGLVEHPLPCNTDNMQAPNVPEEADEL